MIAAFQHDVPAVRENFDKIPMYSIYIELELINCGYAYISSFGVQNQADCDDNRLNAQDICMEVQRKVE